jgi:Na+-driven multidrug efflux pump
MIALPADLRTKAISMDRTGFMIVGGVIMLVGAILFLASEPIAQIFSTSFQSEMIVAYAGLIAFFVGLTMVLVAIFRNDS